MFGRFRGFRDRLRKRGAHVDQELTLENSNLSSQQIATAQKALKILGLEPRRQNLEKQDFIVFLYAMGLNPTDDIIDSKIRAFKLHTKKTFTFGQLAHVWYSMLQDLTDEDEILKRAFQFFDKDGNGEISVQELKTTMHELGDLLSEEEIGAFMAIMDVNNDGVIGYTEFLATLKTQAPELGGDSRQPDEGDIDRSMGSALHRAGAHHFEHQQVAVPTSPNDTLVAAAASLSASAAPTPRGAGGEDGPAAPSAHSTEPGGSDAAQASSSGAAPGASSSGAAPPHSPLRQQPAPDAAAAAPPPQPQLVLAEPDGPPPPPPPQQRPMSRQASIPPSLGRARQGAGADAAAEAAPGQAAAEASSRPQAVARGDSAASSAADSLEAATGHPGTPGAAGSGAGGGLRAPSALEAGPGSDGSGSPDGRTGRAASDSGPPSPVQPPKVQLPPH